MMRSMLIAAALALAAGAAWAEPDASPASIADVSVARRMKRDGDLAGAVTKLRDVVRREPGYFEANRRLGEYLAEQGQHAEAVGFLEKAAELREQGKVKDDSIYNSLGWAYLLNGDYGKAELALLKASKGRLAADAAVKASNNLGFLYLATGQYDRSRSVFSANERADKSGFATDQLRTLDRLQKREAAKPSR